MPEKVGCISALLEQYASRLAADRRFRLDQEADQEAPSALVWVLYYQAQHLDYMSTRKHTRPTHLFCEKTTPTVVSRCNVCAM